MYPALLSSEPRLPGVRRRPMKRQVKVRIMLPMSIRCNTCGNHICRGTKFSSRKEEAVGVTYLGIQRFRFYFECSKCYAELTIKAYPRDPDCMVESEATRVEDSVVENGKRKRDAEEMGDVMKSTSSDSKREIDILPALDDMDSMKEHFLHTVVQFLSLTDKEIGGRGRRAH
ncbi:splicing factor YJU2-like [Eucalyptus grandis]|uniref:splicing factor YJU2-like n=1 Tax=Eucalyptus grandis TaxID=71139 RepID=UPI00192EA09E|nr:splicing factor YJU2-like [Eucalyptus grandis]